MATAAAWPNRNGQVRRAPNVMLRTPTSLVRARLHWPARGPSGRPSPLLVLFNDAAGRPGGAEFAAVLDAVVLATSLQDASEGLSLVEWAADHAAALGVDDRRLMIAGSGTGAALANDVATLAAGGCWPPIALLVLIDPVDTGGDVDHRPNGIRTHVVRGHGTTHANAFGAIARSLRQLLRIVP